MLRDGNRRAFGRSGGFSPTLLTGLVAWYRFGLGITIATGVSQWNDASGQGNHLIQATTTRQPLLQADKSLLFDGANDVLVANAFTLNQPETVYFLGKEIAWTSGAAIFDGNTSNTMALQQTNAGASPQLRLFAGSAVGNNTDLAIGTYGVISCVFNGASSVLQVNNGTATTGNVGANNADGFFLGAAQGPLHFSNIQVKEVIIYAAAHNAAQRAQVIGYLQQVGGL